MSSSRSNGQLTRCPFDSSVIPSCQSEEGYDIYINDKQVSKH